MYCMSVVWLLLAASTTLSICDSTTNSTISDVTAVTTDVSIQNTTLSADIHVEGSYKSSNNDNSNANKNFEPVNLGDNDTSIEIIYPTQPTNFSTFAPPKLFKDFKPSQPLDAGYEFNRKPVVPAIGEAKSFGDLGHFGIKAKIPTVPWLKVRHFFNNHESHESESGSHEEGRKSHEQDDVKIRFPTPTPTPSTYPYSYINPMQYYPKLDANIPHDNQNTKNININTNNNSNNNKKDNGVLIINKKPHTQSPLDVDSTVRSTPKSIITSEEYYEPSIVNHGVANPNFYPQTSPDIGYNYNQHNTHQYQHHGTTGTDFNHNFGHEYLSHGTKHPGHSLMQYHYNKPFSYEKPKYDESKSLGSPWKKVIKFLTAIIPFGLLISALTPTVIDVSPMPNQTAINNGFNSGRARVENKNVADTTTESTSKNYLNLLKVLEKEGCEDRVLCELIVSSGSSYNSHVQVSNLLDTFVGSDEDNAKQKEELSKIFKAARNDQCDILACSQIPEPKRDDQQKIV